MSEVLDPLLRGEHEATPQEPDPSVAQLPLLSFRLGGEVFALPRNSVRVITLVGKIARVPGAGAPVLGITHHRGDLLPVIDLAQALGLSRDPSEGEHLIIIDSARSEVGLACVAGELVDLHQVDESQLMPAPSSTNAATLRHLRGVLKLDQMLIGVLSPESLDEVRG